MISDSPETTSNLEITAHLVGDRRQRIEEVASIDVHSLHQFIMQMCSERGDDLDHDESNPLIQVILASGDQCSPMAVAVFISRASMTWNTLMIIFTHPLV